MNIEVSTVQLILSESGPDYVYLQLKLPGDIWPKIATTKGKGESWVRENFFDVQFEIIDTVSGTKTTEVLPKR